MTQRQLREQEVQIARYQFLSREVTDPLAACLLRIIIGELEGNLARDREIGQRSQIAGPALGRDEGDDADGLAEATFRQVMTVSSSVASTSASRQTWPCRPRSSSRK